MATLSAMDGAALFSDWAGGLIWLQLPVSHDGGAEAVRAAVSVVGGHATLLRAGQDIRAAVPVFNPQPDAVATLSLRLKESFDPKHILNPGRMYKGV